mgnify:CR=1 FL=1
MIKKIIRNKAEINKEELKIKLLEYFKYIDRVYLDKLFDELKEVEQKDRETVKKMLEK